MKNMSPDAMRQKLLRSATAWPKSRDDYTVPIAVEFERERTTILPPKTTDRYGVEYSPPVYKSETLFLRVTTGDTKQHYSQIKLKWMQLLDLATDEELLDLLAKRSKARARNIRNLESDMEKAFDRLDKHDENKTIQDSFDNAQEKRIKALEEKVTIADRIAKALQE